MTFVQPIYLPKRRVHRKRKQPVKQQPPPPEGPPVLVSVAYEQGEWVRLVFDRAIDTAMFDVASVGVNDGNVPGYLVGTGEATQPTAMSVVVQLSLVDPEANPGVTMYIGVGNGIVSASDGSAWAGTEANVEIPFG